LLQRPEASQQQARAQQQHDRERDLTHHQQATQVLAPAACGRVRATFAKRLDEIRT